jgi:putative transcriptional regulator
MAAAGSLKGRLLIALPVLQDPNFDRTIVFMLHHDEEGAVGVVLNRPTRLEVVDALPQWGDALASPPVFFVGGPVGPSSAICVARLRATVGDAVGDAPDAGWHPVDGRIGTLDLNLDPAEVEAEVEAIRVFSGYSGWRGGQLEDELVAGAWLVADAVPDDPLSAEPTLLWRTVLRRQPGSLALLSLFPEDPSLN